jgi:hypothetical protein
MNLSKFTNIYELAMINGYEIWTYRMDTHMRLNFLPTILHLGACVSIVGWGTMLQDRRPWIQFPMRPLDFSIDLMHYGNNMLPSASIYTKAIWYLTSYNNYSKPSVCVFTMPSLQLACHNSRSKALLQTKHQMSMILNSYSQIYWYLT